MLSRRTVRIAATLLALFASAFGARSAFAGSSDIGDLLVSIGGVGNRVMLYDGQSGGIKNPTFAYNGGFPLNGAQGLAFGPGGSLYVASQNLDSIVKFDGITGTFQQLIVNSGAGGLSQPHGLTIHNNQIFVSSFGTNGVKRYDAITGAFIGDFVAGGSGGLDGPTGLIFGPDGNLYVSSSNSDQVLKYNGNTGAFMGIFASPNRGAANSLDRPIDLKFGPDGNLYVASSGNDSVLRFDGSNGGFLNTFVPSGGVADLQNPWGIAFKGDVLYVASRDTHSVKMFGGNGSFTGNFTQPFASPLAQYLAFNTAVPEPATLLLLAGGTVLALRRRSR